MKLLIGITLLLIYSLANATSVALYNFSTGKLESSLKYEHQAPIASVTKLFTAAAVIASGVDLNEKVKVTGSTRGIFTVGKKVARINLMKAMLISSDNLAADTLANAHPGGYKEFIKFVNDIISEIGLVNTKIFDASGLSVFNISTPHDLLKFIWHLQQYPIIVQISSRANDDIEIDSNKKNKVKLHIRNTNPDISKYDVLISKTGFTGAAGRCLVMLVRTGNDLIGIAVLGFNSQRTRSEAVAQLINYRQGNL